MNTALDLKNSKLTEVIRQESTITALFQPAYLHKSEGRPGIDAGTVWLQDLRLVFSEASMSGNLPELPSSITSGESVVSGLSHPNLIPISRKPTGQAQVRLRFGSLHTVEIAAKETRIELIDEPLFLQLFNT